MRVTERRLLPAISGPVRAAVRGRARGFRPQFRARRRRRRLGGHHPRRRARSSTSGAARGCGARRAWRDDTIVARRLDHQDRDRALRAAARRPRRAGRRRAGRAATGRSSRQRQGGGARAPLPWPHGRPARLGRAGSTFDDLYDWEKCTSLLAAQAPWWEPGTASAYHAVTQGYLVGEVIRADHRPDALGPSSRGDRRAAGRRVPHRRRPEHDHRIGASSPHTAAAGTPEPGQHRHAHRTTIRRLPRERGGEERWLRAEIPAGNGFANARGVARIQRCSPAAARPAASG